MTIVEIPIHITFLKSLMIYNFSWQEKDVELIKQSLTEGYENSYWTCSVAKLGYSGTAIISRVSFTEHSWTLVFYLSAFKVHVSVDS